MALSLGRHFSEDVAFVRPFYFVPGSGSFESLFSAGIGFSF
jgi:hypothetical protein